MLNQSLIYIPSIVGIFAIALFVLSRSKQSTFRLFGLFTLSLGFWQLLQYFVDVQVGNGTFLLKLVAVDTLIIAVLFTAFAYTYPHHNSLSPKKTLMLLLPGVFLVPACFTSLVVGDVQYLSAGVKFTPGPLYSIETAATLIYFIIGGVILFRRLRHSDSVQRGQIYTLLAAFVVGVGGNVLAGVIFVDSAIWQVARPVSIMLMAGIIAYAMIYRHLFDIRKYVVRAAAYSLTFVIVAGIYILVAVLATIYALDAPLEPRVLIALSAMTIIVATLFHPLQVYFNKLTNKLFFRDYYDPQVVLDRISKLLVGIVDIDEVRKQTVEILNETLHPLSVNFLLRANSDGKANHLLDALLKTEKGVIVIDELNAQDSQHFKDLKTNQVALAVRLSTAHDNLGFLLLGARSSGVLYSIEDQRLLSVVADELALGMQNALRFQEIQKFNLTLQEKIEEATRKLRHSNDKLRKLDETKDDFISMASHQLRTPLTSVKGYVSMVLDGDAGKLNALQAKLLTQSFVSAQRMVYLISDLLNVSRLKTGKFIIEPVPTNIAKMIDQELDQLTETAKGRKLELSYNKPEHFPTYMLDETKLRQVIMNFVDNAIYYTPSGGHITVNLEDKPKTIEMTVVDDGIGVPRHEQHHLFGKFFRAHNAQRARPDGTGLGLFMAKKVIIAQGGALIFKSQEGKGSTFGFTFAKSRLDTPPAASKSSKK